jgi:hypothetical protein
MNIKLKVLLLLVASVTGVKCISQGKVDGFFKGKGNTEIVLGGGAEFAQKFYAGREKIALGRTIYNANLFIAAGLFDRLDLYLAAPYVKINTVNSIQDGSVYLKYKVFNKDLENGNLSASLAAGFSGNLANYQTEGLNAIGQQAKVLDIRPVVHYFSKSGWFGTVQVGYNHKQNPVPSALNSSLKVGKAASKYYFDVWYDYLTSFGGLDYRGTPAPSTFRELGVDYHKIGGTFYTSIFQRLGGFVGASYVITGRNLGKGTGINLGLVLKSN